MTEHWRKLSISLAIYGDVTWVVYNHIAYTKIFLFEFTFGVYYVMQLKLAEIKLVKSIWCR